MASSASLADLDRRHLWHPFTQAQTAPDPIVVRTAKGARITAEDGRDYLDLVSSWWVNLHGHGHPDIARAIGEQAERLEHVMFAGLTHEPAITLAKRLVDLLPTPLARVFYSDNGATAVEIALKIAYQYWRNRGVASRTRFLAFEGGYHGDTVGAMSLGKGSGFYGPFEALMIPVDLVPYPATFEGDLEVEAREAGALAALESLLAERPEGYAAAIIEPLVQGAAGFRVCRPEFLRAVASRLARAGTLFIFDEVMTGFGRTGAMFACGKAGVTPDILCLAKGLTGGFLPLAATVCREEIYAAFLSEDVHHAFLHGHSYTANPIGCAAALASLDLFEKEHTLARVAEIERLYRARFQGLAARPNVERTRVLGSIAAFEVKTDSSGYGAAVGATLKAMLMEQGLLLRPLGNVVYLIPPYCIADQELHHAFDVLDDALERVR
jgi:adenosylmethionine-8-amino-7-oxononanoate aminotransferase